MRGVLSEPDRRHLETCDKCAAFRDGLDFVSSMADAGVDSPAPALKARIRTSIDRAPRRPRPVAKRRPIWYRWALAGFVACLIAGVGVKWNHGHIVEFTPLFQPVDAMQMVENAFAGVRNAHFVMYTTDYKTDNDTVSHHFAAPQKVEEQWYENGRWRKEGVWGSRLIVGHPLTYLSGQPVYGTYYRYDARRQAVIGVPELGKQMEDFTFEGVTGIRKDSGYKTRVVWNNYSEGPKAWTDLALTRPDDPGARILCRLDYATHLPIDVKYQSLKSGVWSTTTRYHFDFNQNLPASLFDPKTLKHEHWRM